MSEASSILDTTPNYGSPQMIPPVRIYSPTAERRPCDANTLPHLTVAAMHPALGVAGREGQSCWPRRGMAPSRAGGKYPGAVVGGAALQGSIE